MESFIGEVFTFVEEREQYATRSRTVPHIALIADYTSNRYWDNGDFSTLGACKMLIEGHQQFDLFYNDDFPDLSPYSVVVLPETVRLNKDSILRIKDFVRNGGLLLAEGKATLPEGNNNFLLSDVYGLEYLEYAPYRFAYMGINQEIWKNTADIPQLVDGAFIKAIPTTAQVLSKIQWPCGESVPPRAFRHQMPPPGDMSDYPAISLNTYGEGKAIYFASPIFKTYWEQNHFWLKNIFNNCLNQFDRHKPYVIEGYPGLEATMTVKENKRFIHLINFQNTHSGNRRTAYYDPVEHITPIHNLSVKIRNTGINEVILQPEGLKVEFTSDGDYITLTIPQIHIYSILSLYY